MNFRRSSMLRLHSKIAGSSVNGPGNRFVIWVQGCPHACPGCFNPETWNFEGGESVFPSDLKEEILSSGCDGLTISGGEPMSQSSAIYDLLLSLHSEDGELSAALPRGIIMFTGWTLEEIDSYVPSEEDQSLSWARECLPLLDLVVDGRFVESLRVHDQLSGSSNQRFVFSNVPGRGRALIGEEDVITDQAVEIHSTSDPKRVAITGFPTVDRRLLKSLGLRVIQ